MLDVMRCGETAAVKQWSAARGWQNS